MGPRSHERGNDVDVSRAGVRLPLASMGPRSHERGNVTSVQAISRIALTLQWGRVLMNAETASNLTGQSPFVLLQWGRVLMNAETASNLTGQSPFVLLQWGRVLMNAETLGPAAGFRSGVSASMGPRSHERGNNADVPSRGKGSMLQWGRVLMNAETSPTCWSKRELRRLQWGRVLMNAETKTTCRASRNRRGRFNGAAFS